MVKQKKADSGVKLSASDKLFARLDECRALVAALEPALREQFEILEDWAKVSLI